jgi:hypothetical protein
MKLADEIIALWADIFPVHGYIAGLEEAKGKLFFNTAESRKAAFGKIEALEQRLGEIDDENLRATAAKLLRAFRASLAYVYPHSEVETCAWGLFVIMLKKDFQAPFIPEYLRNVEQMLAMEIEKWRGHEVPIELRKLCVDNADFLLATLDILRQQNEEVAGPCQTAKEQLAVYRSLFHTDDIDSRDFGTTLALLRKESTGLRVTEGYDEILRDLYDFPETAEELRAQALDWLAEEMPLLKASADRLAEEYGLGESTAEEVYAEMIRRHPVSEDVIGQAYQLMDVANRYTVEHILDIGPEDEVHIERTPDYLEPLGTSAMCAWMDELTDSIKIICYITPSRNESWLIMLSALMHEFGHGFHASLTFRMVKQELLKLSTTLLSPLTEAICFHRGTELLEEVTSLLGRKDLAPEEKAMLELFGQRGEEQRRAIMGLELETRVARIVRFLRISCDVEVNTGLRSYPDFLDWAHERTELSRKLIYENTFAFLGDPGYSPCYAIAGNKLGELQRAALAEGVSRKEFNTKVSGMGFWPRTIYEQMLSPGQSDFPAPRWHQ